MNYQFYTHFESGMGNKLYTWWFALKKVLYQNYHIFFYSIDACGNGYLRNIVTTYLFMTLLLLYFVHSRTRLYMQMPVIDKLEWFDDNIAAMEILSSHFDDVLFTIVLKI